MHPVARSRCPWLLLLSAVLACSTPSAVRPAPTATPPLPGNAPSAFAPALQLLAQLPHGAPLAAALAEGQVRVRWARSPLAEAWAQYDHEARVIRVDPSLRGADARTLAALLAHEGAQVLGDLDGTVAAAERALGVVEACYVDEERATRIGLRVWQVLHGAAGKAAPVHPYERELNAALAAYHRAPEEFGAYFRRGHAAQCAGTAGPQRRLGWLQ